MVLNELGGKISAALKSFTNQKVVDEKALEALLKEVCGALLHSDVNVRLVQELRKNIKASVKFDDQAGTALNRKRILHKVSDIFELFFPYFSLLFFAASILLLYVSESWR